MLNKNLKNVIHMMRFIAHKTMNDAYSRTFVHHFAIRTFPFFSLSLFCYSLVSTYFDKTNRIEIDVVIRLKWDLMEITSIMCARNEMPFVSFSTFVRRTSHNAYDRVIKLNAFAIYQLRHPIPHISFDGDYLKHDVYARDVRTYSHTVSFGGAQLVHIIIIKINDC